MIRTIWRSIKRLLALVLRKRRSPQQARSRVEALIPEPIVNERSQLDCEVLFFQLLRKVAQGDERSQVEAFLISQSVTAAELAEWLRGFKLSTIDANFQSELGPRFKRLGRLQIGELSCVAEQIGRQLLADEAEEVRSQSIHSELALTQSQLRNKDAETWVERGNQLYKIGNFQEAIASFGLALKIDPNYYEAWVNCSRSQFKLGHFDKAIASCKHALDLKPNSYEAWSLCAYLLINLGHPKESIAACNRALAIKPNSYEAWVNRSWALLQLGHYEEAVTACERALAIRPDDHQTLLNLSSALIELERCQEAIITCDRALKNNLNSHEAWTNYATALINLERYEEAVSACDRALVIQPNFHLALGARGNALISLEEYGEAVNTFDRILAISPNSAETWNNRSVALNELGKHKEALANCDRALAISPNFSKALSTRGYILVHLGEYDEAIINYDQAVAISPSIAAIWQSRANPLYSLKRYEEGIASYDHALAISPNLHEVWNDRGNAAEDSNGRGKSLFTFSLPLAMQNPSLDKRGYEGRLASIQEGFRYVAKETKGWGLLHSYLGSAYRDQAQGTAFPCSLWRKAAISYKAALQTLTSDRFPQNHLDVLRDLIGVLFALHETEEAQMLQRDASDLLQRLLSDPTRFPAQQRSLLSKQSSFNQISVDVAVQSGDTIAALQLAEHGKNTCLRWMLEIDEPPEVTYANIQAWLPPTAALLYWHLSPIALTTFVILPGYDCPRIVSPPIALPSPYVPTVNTDETDQRPAILKQLLAWETWLKEWNQDYRLYIAREDQPQRDHPWRTQMNDRLDALWQILNISAIVDLLTPKITELILVPHRDLHRFPLHAFFNLPCTHLPSIHLGLNNLAKTTHGNRLLLIENPTTESVSGGGTFIEIESALIQHLFPTQVIERENATAAQVKSALSQPHHLLHFSGHAAYNSHNPSQSCLYLSGTDRLTLTTLAHLDLSSYALICLAACETGITGKQTVSDEYVGLPSAFLKAKASRIVSTFWRVESAVSTYFMVEFYRSIATGNAPRTALQHAQTFLKTATCQALVAWIDAALPDLPRACQIALRAEQQRIATALAERPYDNPYYWAAFAISGQ